MSAMGEVREWDRMQRWTPLCTSPDASIFAEGIEPLRGFGEICSRCLPQAAGVFNGSRMAQ